MLILAIETSCDETSCAVVRDGTKVLSCVIHSQISLHEKTGGVVPEVAAREHVQYIIPVLEKSLSEASVTLADIDAIAVTKEPGLLPSLLIGLQTAKTLAFTLGKPLIETNHIMGHLFSNWLDRNAEDIQFPVVVLTVSGGHNDLFLMRSVHDIEMIGTTLDDAAGEAFDKVARLLGLGYPGGPAISKVAKEGSVCAFDFPRAWLSEPGFHGGWDKKRFDFSFSGLKTKVLQTIQSKLFETKFVSDIAASFQESVCDVLSAKLVHACEKFGAKEAHLAGGVSANLRLRELVKERLPETVTLRVPDKFVYCTDNAAMIASAAFFLNAKEGDQR